MIRILLSLILAFYSFNAYAAAPSRPFNYVSNNTIDPVQNNTNENTLYTYLQTGVDTYADGSIVGDDISASAAIPYSKLALTGSIGPSDISSGSFLLPSGAVFFMITGSCPTGTTDVSGTYSNKYVKINATAGTSSGVVLTGTTDSHVLTVPEIPAHTHSYDTPPTPGAGGSGGSYSGTPTSATTGSTGGGLGHTHTLSTASTLEPSSVTMKACQVN